jgi:hypothetical protein
MQRSHRQADQPEHVTAYEAAAPPARRFKLDLTALDDHD